MVEFISAADANRGFSRILSGVREGRSYVVTSHGRAVARISPADSEDEIDLIAREVLLERLKRQPARNIGPWSRDELYDEDL